MRTHSLFHLGEVTRWRGVTKRTTSVWLASLLFLAGPARLALAIGPDYQIATTALTAGTPVSSVVDFLSTPASQWDIGTGDIFTEYASNGMDYADVLTADHVGSAGAGGGAGYNAYVGIGVNNGVAPTVGANLFQETLLSAGGPAANVNFEDMDIVQIALGATNNANAMALFNSIIPMNILNPNLYPTTLFTNVNPIYNSFTEYGYGRAGKPLVQGGTNGYGGYRSPFNLRFQNNLITSVVTSYVAQSGTAATGNNMGNPYVEPLVSFKTIAPTNLSLQGTSFAGDSGGPYDYLGSASVTVSNNYTGQPITNAVFTDYQFAVHVLGAASGSVTNIPGTNGLAAVNARAKLNGDINSGVYIDAANYNWIESFVVVPEPSSGLLVLIGGCVLAGFARLSNRRKVKR